MKNSRLVLFSFLICLPALLIVGAGAYFILTEVPRAVRREAAGIAREYHEIAEDLIAHPERATYVGGRKVGWESKSSKIDGRTWGAEVGFDKEGRRTRVWFKSDKAEWRAIEIETIRPFPYEPVFYGGGLLVSIVLLGLSALAVGCFVRYVKSRDDFLAATAHDLTTPLVGMRMMIGRCDEEAKNLNERMLLIVSNIKDFLKLGGRRRAPELKPVDLVALAKEAYQLFAADYEDSEGGPVAFECSRLQSKAVEPFADESLSVVALADETLTLQILWNLFGNDLKYAAPYGKVAVRFAADARFVRVEFVDEGQGMTSRQMKRAFDRYYRARTVLESGKGGFGIGLCTAREFARAMGGDLSVRANRPKGCVFTLKLRCADRGAAS